MRNPTLAALLVALLAGPAAAQPAVKITSARIGLPPGRFVSDREDNGSAAHVAKNNTWAPVYVDLEIVREVKAKAAAIVIETKDPDDLTVTTWVPLPNLTGVPPGTRIAALELPRTPYVRPSGRSDEIVIAVRAADTGDPADWRNLADPFRVRYVKTRDVSKFVILSLGTKLPGFDLPNENADPNADTGRTLRGGRVETAAVTEVGDLPDHWFGYEAADLVILTTGATNQNFLTNLFDNPANKPRLDALLEWVRRGGRLVVSVGTNAGLVFQYPAFAELFPVEVKKTEATAQLDSQAMDFATRTPSGMRNRNLPVFQPRGGAKVPVANLVPKPDRPFRQLVPAPPPPESGDRAKPPVVVQSAYGLGRVTLVGFDLDRSPFLEYPGRAEFWDHLTREAGTAAAAAARKQNNFATAGMQTDTEDDLAAAVRTHIDTFEGVPVISFGWVAVFILLYTLLIGPVEYFVLKKVFKRLELTWITFPIIVLTVSAIAYFTAYSLKGDDLKINKMDVVDVDPASGRVYGRTWFTLFSPRIESYTIGVEPNDGWGAKAADQPAPLVDWLGGTKSGRGGIFSRRYQYHIDPDTGAFADGLVGVPIQVWSTKAFAADWSARTDKAAPPVTSNLVHPPANRWDVAGTFTLNLPTGELKDVRLVYRGKAYKLDNPITPGTPVTVLLRDANLDSGWPSNGGQWAGGNAVAGPTGQKKGATVFAAGQVMSALFHESATKAADGTAALGNASLRRLDQSWRMAEDYVDEVIVVGRLDAANGPAEELLAANGPSPTRLWLKGLPGSGKPRDPVRGTLRQETYVRVFVPVKPARK